MAAFRSTFQPAPKQTAIPDWLVRVCLVLAVANVTLCLCGVFLALVGLRCRAAAALRNPISSTSGRQESWRCKDL